MVCATTALALFAYIPGFGLFSQMVRRPLIAGGIYTAIFEVLLADIDFVVRRGTVMYWERVLWIRGIGVSGPWAIAEADAPSAATALAVLLGTGIMLTVVGAWIFAEREIRVKTSESG